jgi:hypothetical protein
MKCIIDKSQLNTLNKLRIYWTLKKKVNNIRDSVKKVTMKIKEIARSILHFALNIFSLSPSYFQKY